MQSRLLYTHSPPALTCVFLMVSSTQSHGPCALNWQSKLGILLEISRIVAMGISLMSDYVACASINGIIALYAITLGEEAR